MLHSGTTRPTAPDAAADPTTCAMVDGLLGEARAGGADAPTAAGLVNQLAASRCTDPGPGLVPALPGFALPGEIPLPAPWLSPAEADRIHASLHASTGQRKRQLDKPLPQLVDALFAQHLPEAEARIGDALQKGQRIQTILEAPSFGSLLSPQNRDEEALVRSTIT
ncbi:hypothetical protein H696_05145 [Fonticula alba]|uniref:Uncharacterized protein n=1 Tax=Fonticula alba TaxID=691883 RepID=A0A058Z1S7_FONAL|nr:hypothetical protein H696_05145 [Fonticula alba]KCV68220.1 hypothetical protein H696_05145 [Fonticula alba]|eukprot:XP_009497274.1 hypothetical protein H696_05145 [Fonticula alba]